MANLNIFARVFNPIGSLKLMAGHFLVMAGLYLNYRGTFLNWWAVCIHEVCVDLLGSGGGSLLGECVDVLGECGHELLKETRIRLGNHYKPVKFIQGGVFFFPPKKTGTP